MSAEMIVEQEPGGLIPVAIETLRSAPSLPFPLYVVVDATAPPKLFRSENIPLSSRDLDRLEDRGVRTLYTDSGMSSQYRDHLRSHVLTDRDLPLSRRYEILKQAARATFDQALDSRDVNNLAHVTNALGREIADFVTNQEVLLLDLLEVMFHDFSTYTHVTHVCTYSVLLAQRLGISDRQELNEIAAGALLHDVGKQFVPDAILQKKGILTPAEEEVVRTHPQRGFEVFCRRSDVAWGGLMMAYQHHERCNGRGYPVGFVGNEIHPWARICAVADVFDALLRDRPYRGAKSLDSVLTYFELQAGKGFDKEVTQCWISTIKAN